MSGAPGSQRYQRRRRRPRRPRPAGSGQSSSRPASARRPPTRPRSGPGPCPGAPVGAAARRRPGHRRERVAGGTSAEPGAVAPEGGERRGTRRRRPRPPRPGRPTRVVHAGHQLDEGAARLGVVDRVAAGRRQLHRARAGPAGTSGKSAFVGRRRSASGYAGSHGWSTSGSSSTARSMRSSPVRSSPRTTRSWAAMRGERARRHVGRQLGPGVGRRRHLGQRAEGEAARARHQHRAPPTRPAPRAPGGTRRAPAAGHSCLPRSRARRHRSRRSSSPSQSPAGAQAVDVTSSSSRSPSSTSSRVSLRSARQTSGQG